MRRKHATSKCVQRSYDARVKMPLQTVVSRNDSWKDSNRMSILLVVIGLRLTSSTVFAFIVDTPIYFVFLVSQAFLATYYDNDFWE